MDTLRYVLGIPSLRPKKWLSFLRIWGSVYHPRYDFKTMIHVLEAATALQVFQHGRIPPRTTEVRTGLRRVFLRTFTLVKACQQTALRAGCLRRESGKCVVTVSIVVVLERRQRFCTPLILTRNWFAFNTKRRWVEKRWVKEYKERGENRCAYDCCCC
jgi:hypothetical protein